MSNLLDSKSKINLFQLYFSNLPDPRRTEKGRLRHCMSDILLLTFSACFVPTKVGLQLIVW